MNDILLLYECRLGGGDTLTWWGHSNPTSCNITCLNLLYSETVGIKHLGMSARSLDTPPHLMEFPLPNILNFLISESVLFSNIQIQKQTSADSYKCESDTSLLMDTKVSLLNF